MRKAVRKPDSVKIIIFRGVQCKKEYLLAIRNILDAYLSTAKVT